jgi:hypothetical protein
MHFSQEPDWESIPLDKSENGDPVRKLVEPLEDNPPTTTAKGQSHLIGKVLSPAIRLWLRSQVEHVDELEFQIAGGDRQLLAGYIPQVSISAQNAVYRGLHLSEIALTGCNIQINLGQIWRGKPLRLKDVVPVEGVLLMRQAAFNASLRSPLLGEAVVEFVAALLRSQQSGGFLEIDQDEPLNLQSPQVFFTAGKATLSVSLISTTGEVIPIIIRTGLRLVNGNILSLNEPQWLTRVNSNRGLPLKDLQDFQIPLGTDVYLHELHLEEEQLRCRGRINVIPQDDV